MPEGQHPTWVVAPSKETVLRKIICNRLLPSIIMIRHFFRVHGEFCASHPWEVIVALLTVTACMLTVDRNSDGNLYTKHASHKNPCHGWKETCDGLEAEYNAADVILMTIVRCSAVLYCYYQFGNLHKIGSKYILGIAGLFTVFSSFIFTTTIIKLFGSDISDLKDALFFLLLLIDLSNSGTLAKQALNGANQPEVIKNIANGMQLIGPAISLDTLVEALVIGVGTLSGVKRLEILCTFAVISVLVNYIVFMTFFPACLSLILDLTRNGVDISLVKSKAKDSLSIKSFYNDEPKINPVVQRVKIIMSTGLMVVHVYSRIFITNSDRGNNTISAFLMSEEYNDIDIDKRTGSKLLFRWLTMSADQVVILILLVALVVKFIFFESHNEHHEQNQLSIGSFQATKANQLLDIRKSKDKRIFSCSNMDGLISASEISDEKSIEEGKCITNTLKKSRNIQEYLQILKSEGGPASLSDEEIIYIIREGGGHCPLYKIESIIKDPERGVHIRRKILCHEIGTDYEKLSNLSYKDFDYSKVMNACCENVIGYVEIPVGYAGPLLLDGHQYYIPMATTEGALVASTNRGCKALSVHGVTSYVEDIGMTRAPCVKFPSVKRAAEAKNWINSTENYHQIKCEFDSTSRFGRLKELMIAMDGPQLYLRFVALTGDAMGMNMVSKGAEMALQYIKRKFPDMKVISLSGNFCSDKKPAAINWIKGRGKRVVTECVVPEIVLKDILKTEAKTLVECNKAKNMSGSAMAGTIGGNNAHAANMVTAIFIATGQDPAQNVTSSNCSTAMECRGNDLYITCTMPSLEVGTVGGGTGLAGQSACLDILGVRGAHLKNPGENAKKLSAIICAAVMAGEISLMAALVNSDLVKSHMRHNRSSAAVHTDS